MKDIQSQYDSRRISIKKVGVKDISYPITVLDKARKVQQTVARVNMYVNLPHQFKGTHMSRFIEILNQVHGSINLENLHTILHDMKDRLQAQEAHIEIEFPYFLHRSHDSQESVSLGEYHCAMHGSLNCGEELTLTVKVPIAAPQPAQGKNVLPRSLGHWGFAHIALKFRHFIWLEDIITMVEEVTAHRLSWVAAQQPDEELSVERLTSALACKLAKCTAIGWFSVRVENLSQGYSTFAALEWSQQNHNPPH